jgi:CheY-like chemotaxis protein
MGGDAIAILEHSPARPFDAAIVDLRLPRVSGDEVVRYMRSRRELQNIPMVMLTGGDCEHVHREHPDLPRDRCHQKPATFEGYLQLVHRLKRDLLVESKPLPSTEPDRTPVGSRRQPSE